jgi:predicted dehydrogenase
MGGRKDDKTLQEIPIPDGLKTIPEELRTSAEPYDVGQMWARFAESIRSGKSAEPDFDFAVKRHRLLDAIRRASDTGQRQKVTL